MNLKEELGRFFSAGRDTAYQALWLAVFSLVGTALLMAQGIASDWSDALIFCFLGASGAFFWMVLALTGLLAIRSRGRRAVARIRGTSYINGEKGFLDFRYNLALSQVEMMKALRNIGAVHTRLARSANADVLRIQRANQSGSIWRQHRAFARASRRIEKHTDELEGYAKAFADSAAIFSESGVGIFHASTPMEPEARAALEPLRSVISGMLSNTVGARQSSESFRDSVAGVRGVSQDLNRASDRLVSVAQAIVETLNVVEEGAKKMLTRFDQL